jgi:hypothetical protein
MKRYVGTARREGVENKKPRWILKVTDTKTNKVVEETVFLHKSVETAISQAFELARQWREKDEGASS